MSDLPPALIGRRVLLTGATGFIGGSLARRLLAGGVALRTLVRDRDDRALDLEQAGAELVLGDLAMGMDSELAAGIDIVVHAAAWVGTEGDAERVRAINVEGTRRILSVAKAAGVERIVHVSSCAVYGSPQRDGIDESAALRRRGVVYHDSKVEADELALDAAAAGAPIVIARPSQVYGPGSREFTVRPVTAIRAGRALLIDGGRHRCKLVYIDDAVDGLIACMAVQGIEGEAFNLTAPPVSWRELFEGYGNMLGSPRIRSVPRSVAWMLAWVAELAGRARGGKPPITREIVAALTSDSSFSAAKAAERLGWQARVDLDEGLRRTEPWLRAQGLLEPR
jgi:nucleoside-diphosphate-sugar epimerase